MSIYADLLPLLKDIYNDILGNIDNSVLPKSLKEIAPVIELLPTDRELYNLFKNRNLNPIVKIAKLKDYRLITPNIIFYEGTREPESSSYIRYILEYDSDGALTNISTITILLNAS